MNSASDADDDVDEMEELLQKHRKEKRELQGKFFRGICDVLSTFFVYIRCYLRWKLSFLGKLQALKKSASKGDKKKKKEVTEEMSRLETEMNQRHETEISELKEKVTL